MRNLSKKAFSFVELLVVITIMSIVGAIWVSLNDGYKEKTYNTKVETDLVTIENALIRYKQEKSYIPLPEGNLKYFSKDGFYAHDESDAYGYHGFITENTIPKRFISVLPRDPRSNNYYAYGKTLSSGFFEVAGVISYGDKYESIVKGNYIGKDPLYNLIREYNGPDFVYDKSKKNFPYNPEEMIMDARIVAFTGELILNNSITEKNKILESKLLPGDNIKLSTGSTASIYYSDGSYSELGSHDGALELTLSVMKYKKDDNLFTRIRLALNYGTILTKASKMSGESNLDLYTIDTEASVRGTIFEMKRLQGDNKTYVKVIKGSIFLNMINIADYDTLLSLLKDDKKISPKTPISFPGYTEVVTVDGHQESILKEGGDFTITASPTIPPTIPPTCATDEHYETVGGCLKNVDNCNFYDTDGTTLIGTGTKSWNITRGNCKATNCLAGFIIDNATKTCIPNAGLCPLNYTWDGTNCIADTIIYSCLAKPANTVWNTVSSYNQTWNGSDWVPSDSTTHYNTAPDSLSCRFRCNTNYSRNGSSCNPDSRLVACGGSIASNSYRTTGVNYTQTWNGTTRAPVK
ncbi:prepilin-type N-terminal cleavage/methylation domain-containing protein, partial [Candidatus Gracilibacteria bacterium]|nr:prepilin-type N-terminal cleavage/methylation domain-containing protein [Candidatus Gracilibacteria bacterium]